MTDKAKKYKEKRAAEKMKKEAKNRARVMVDDENRQKKAISEKV